MTTRRSYPRRLPAALLVALAFVAVALPGAGHRAATGAAPSAHGATAPREHDLEHRVDLSLGVVTATERGAAETDVRVNDAARINQFASCIEQSETTVAGYGDEAYVAYNDTSGCVTGIAGAFAGAVPGSFTGFARSGDGGQTFEDLGPLVPSGPIHALAGDPVLAVDTRGADAGTIYLSSLATQLDADPTLAVGRSRDGGRTWTWFDAAASVANVLDVQDKEWLTIDNTGGPFDGRLYLSWFGLSAGIRFSSSSDGGETWTTPVVIGGGQGSRPAVGPDGEIVVTWEGFPPEGSTNTTINVASSTDGGATFSPAAGIAPTVLTGHSTRCIVFQTVLDGDMRTNEYPSIAIDSLGSPDPSSPAYNPSHGTVYVAYARDGVGADESDVYLVRREPGQTSWSAPHKLNDDATATDQFFPEVAVPAPGTVAVAWTDRREDAAANNLMAQYLVLSRDGGQTFGPNERFSDVLFPPPYTNPNPNPFIATCYAGDYNALASDRPGELIAAWSDNRDVVQASGVEAPLPDPNVYFRRVSIG